MDPHFSQFMVADLVAQMAEWLEFYAKALELNVWTSATVESAFQDSQQKWNVLVKRHGRERRLQVNHLGQYHAQLTSRIHDGYSCVLPSVRYWDWGCVRCYPIYTRNGAYVAPDIDLPFDLETGRTRSRVLYSDHPNTELQMTTVANALWSSGRAILVSTAVCCTSQ